MLARIWSAVLVQTKGLGFSLCTSMPLRVAEFATRSSSPAFNLHRPASAASGFLLTALSNGRRVALLVSTLLREGARPIKHLRHSGPILASAGDSSIVKTRMMCLGLLFMYLPWRRRIQHHPVKTQLQDRGYKLVIIDSPSMSFCVRSLSSVPISGAMSMPSQI